VPLCAARAILHGQDAYACPLPLLGPGWLGPTNPITAAIPLIPVAPLDDAWAVAIVLGVGSGLLAWGLTDQNRWWRLLVFLSFPFLHAIQVVQWAPIICAAAVLPILLPLTLVKPQVGIPIALARLTWPRVLWCAVWLALTFVLDPTWPLRWWPQAHSYDGIIPLLVLPLGPALLLALRWWRQRTMIQLILMAVMPQRFFYDPLLLSLMPETPLQLVIQIACGWVGLLLWKSQVLAFGHILVLTFYLPTLLLIWPVRHKPATEPETAGHTIGAGISDLARFFRSATGKKRLSPPR
jgi:hypothetical protein